MKNIDIIKMGFAAQPGSDEYKLGIEIGKQCILGSVSLNDQYPKVEPENPLDDFIDEFGGDVIYEIVKAIGNDHTAEIIIAINMPLYAYRFLTLSFYTNTKVEVILQRDQNLWARYLAILKYREEYKNNAYINNYNIEINKYIKNYNIKQY